jgi:hypothetical protein
LSVRISSLDDDCDRVIKPFRIRLEIEVAKKAAKRKITRTEYTASDIKLLKMHSKARTPVSKLAKLMKRSAGSLRQKALKLGIGLGHQR